MAVHLADFRYLVTTYMCGQLDDYEERVLLLTKVVTQELSYIIQFASGLKSSRANISNSGTRILTTPLLSNRAHG